STIFLSGSRGGMVAFAVEMAVLVSILVRQRKSKQLALALGAFLVISVGLLAWLGGGQLTRRMASIRTEARAELSGGTRLDITRILVHSLFDFNLQIPANAALFYVLCAIAAMEPRFGLARRRHSHRSEVEAAA